MIVQRDCYFPERRFLLVPLGDGPAVRSRRVRHTRAKTTQDARRRQVAGPGEWAALQLERERLGRVLEAANVGHDLGDTRCRDTRLKTMRYSIAELHEREQPFVRVGVDVSQRIKVLENAG